MAGTSAQTLGMSAESLHNALMTDESPIEFTRHTTKGDMIAKSLQDILNTHSALEVDYGQLQAYFKNICNDYGEALLWNEKSLAVEFCTKIIYEVDPESRQGIEIDSGKIWKFKFHYKSAWDGKTVVKVAFVFAFESDDAVVETITEENQINLTVKQASLLAMDTFNRIAEAAYNNYGTILLTPTAGAIFSRTELISLARELGFSRNIPKLLDIINSSCQSGGQVLPNSRGHCAAVAAIISTRGIEDVTRRNALVVKLTKQYYSASKPIDMTKFNIFAKHAYGGVAVGYDVESLDRNVKIATRKQGSSLKESAIKSRMDVDGVSDDDEAHPDSH